MVFNTSPSLENGLVADAANQDTAGQLRIRFCNTMSSDLNGASRTHNFLVIR